MTGRHTGDQSPSSGFVSASDHETWKYNVLEIALEHHKRLVDAIQACPFEAFESHHQKLARNAIALKEESVKNKDITMDTVTKEEEDADSVKKEEAEEMIEEAEREGGKASRTASQLIKSIGSDPDFDLEVAHSIIRNDDQSFWRSSEFLVGLMIMLNGVLLLVVKERDGWKASVKLGIQEDKDSLRVIDDVAMFMEYGFSIFFLGDLTYQIHSQRWAFFRDSFNLFDTFVVLSNIAELYILAPLSLIFFDGVTVLRLTRIMRLVRTLRIIRTVRCFGSLRILVRAVVKAYLSFVWSMILLGMFIMMGGLLISELLDGFITNESNDYEMRLWCWSFYGTALRSMYTMFEVTLSGCWPNYARPLLDQVSHFYGLFFLVYVSFVVFAIIRVITAIFLKETLEAASGDADLMIEGKKELTRRNLKKLATVFKLADESGDGELSRYEFELIMMDPKVKTYLSALDLEVHESSLLFDLLDNGDGSITHEEFIYGVSRLKGQARTLDIVALQMDVQRVLKSLGGLSEDLGYRKSYHKRASFAGKRNRVNLGETGLRPSLGQMSAASGGNELILL